LTRTSHNLEALQSSLRESQARYHSVIAAMAEGVVIIGKDGRVIECNEAAQVILDRGLDGIVGRRGSVISRRAIKEGNVRFRASECPIVIALRGSACTGLVMGITSRQGRRWLSINTRPVFDDDGQTVHTVVASFNDITDRRDAEDALKRSQEKSYFLATHDVLTNLPNRSLLHARINHATALAQRTAMQVAILFITSTPADQDAVAIVGAIAALAQGLRLETVGEGTESLSQLELLHNFGYTEAQGNYISAPMPAAEIPSFMNAPPLQWPGGDLFSR
jgi:PAS domain-containing protein